MNRYADTPPTVTPEDARAKLQRAIDRATHKAHEQARAGNRPTLVRTFTSPDGLETRQFWTVGSRTTGGQVYNVDLTADCDGIRTMCDCQATGVCWHRAAVRLAAAGDLECHITRRPLLVITKADLHGAAAGPDPWEGAEAFAAVV